MILSGFRRIDIVDSDVVEVSNLSRQLFFHQSDEGKPKVHVLARNAMTHFRSAKGLEIRPFFCDIHDFFRVFQVKPSDYSFVLSALDNVEARRSLNGKIMEEYGENGSPIFIDGGTEGFNGHCRVIVPNLTPCYECTMDLNVAELTFPLCEIKEFPRTPLHCIAYATFLYEQEQDIPEQNGPQKASVIYQLALKHAESFGIQGVTLELTKQAIGAIIPTLLSTNTIIASSVVSNLIRFARKMNSSSSSFGDMENYFLFYGQKGIYSTSLVIKKSKTCIFCGK
ncbi:NEDD8-activating enzyme E1 catalytic subunit [Cryptosporidium felis]|nr:NEDD8-activating enzyme E1 catalytic subunit [Cryptosporidium felis]